MPAPQVVLDLVKRFNDHEADYRSADYEEAQLRQEFINPMFERLGCAPQSRGRSTRRIGRSTGSCTTCTA